MERYAKKPVNPKYYGTIKIDEKLILEGKKGKEHLAPGYVYAPYLPITIKTILVDENGEHITWNISKWMRLKLWFLKLISKLKKIG